MKKIYKLFLVTTIFIFFSQDVKSQMVWNVAMKTNGTGWVSRLTTSSLDITGSFTLDCWINPAAFPSANTDVISKGSSAIRRYAINFSNSGRLNAVTNGVTRLSTDAATVVPLNEWTHVSLTYSSTSNTFSFYINGALDASAVVAGAAPITDPDDSLLIGKRTSTASIFSGLIDEVRIWNRDLSSGDILNNYRFSLGSTDGLYGGLVFSATFQNLLSSASLHLTDKSGNGNNLVNRGAAALDLGSRPQITIFSNCSVGFDGTNDYLAGPDNSNVSPTTAITMEAWIFYNNSTGLIIHKGTPNLTTTNYRLGIIAGSAYAKLNNGINLPDTSDISPAKWTHVAFTYNSVTSEYKFYIDGVYKFKGTTPAGAITNGTDSLYIGGSVGATDFGGYLDEIRISNYEKTQDEIVKYLHVSIDDSNEPNDASTNVVYNLDGLAVDNTDVGPRLFYRNTARINEWSSPLNKLAPVFSDGYNIKNSNREIPLEGFMITDSLLITQDVTISDINLFVALNHTFTWDIYIALIAPDGTVARAFLGNTSASSNVVTVFDDDADSSLIDGRYTAFTPTIKPFFGLNTALSGKNSRGYWRLDIGDRVFPDGGRLNSWGIQINNQTHAPKNYIIKTFVEGFYNPVLNTQIRDTMRVYLRESSTPFAIVDSAMRYVSDVGLDSFSFGSPNVKFGVDYYIHLKHRNSIETWSSTAKNYNGLTNLFYDFTSSSGSAFGNNVYQVDASPITFAVYSGDVNQDGFVNLTDVINVSNDASAFLTGYEITDVNGDDVTNLSDILIAYNNSVKFVKVMKP